MRDSSERGGREKSGAGVSVWMECRGRETWKLQSDSSSLERLSDSVSLARGRGTAILSSLVPLLILSKL